MARWASWKEKKLTMMSISDKQTDDVMKTRTEELLKYIPSLLMR